MGGGHTQRPLRRLAGGPVGAIAAGVVARTLGLCRVLVPHNFGQLLWGVGYNVAKGRRTRVGRRGTGVVATGGQVGHTTGRHVAVGWVHELSLAVRTRAVPLVPMMRVSGNGVVTHSAEVMVGSARSAARPWQVGGAGTPVRR